MPRRKIRPTLGVELLEDRAVPAIDFTGLSQGINDRLSIIDTAVSGINSARDLPVLNSPLSGIAEVAGFAQSVKDTLRTSLTTPANQVSASTLQQGLFRSLGPTGLNVLGDLNGTGGVTTADVTVGSFSQTSNTVDITLRIFRQIDANGASQFDTGLDALSFAAKGTITTRVSTTFDYTPVNFGMRIASAGQPATFFHTTSAANELAITVKATIPNATADGTLGLLHVAATDGTVQGTTFFNGKFTADVSGAPTGSLGLAGHRLDVTAAIHTKLSADFVGQNGANLPAIRADLDLGWTFSNSSSNGEWATFAAPITSSINNVEVNLGQTFNAIIRPFLEDIRKFTQPLQPILDPLDDPIPLVSDLSRFIGGGDVSVINLAEWLADSGTLNDSAASTLRLLTVLYNLTTSINNLDTSSPDVWLRIGSFQLQGNADEWRGVNGRVIITPDGLGNITPAALALRLDQLSTSTANPRLVDVFVKSGDGSSNTSKAGIDIPIITNPLELIGLFMGREANLITLYASLNARASGRLGIPIGPVEVGLAGLVELDADFTVGYDTRGLRNFRDGFFIDADSHLGLNGGLVLYATGDLEVFEVTVGGGLEANVNVTLSDPDGDGKIRLNELLGDSMLQTTGQVSVGGFARIKAGADLPLIGFVGIKKEFGFANHVLLDLNSRSSGNPFAVPANTRLAALNASTGVLTLNMGSLTSRNARVANATETDEAFYISQENGRIVVRAFGITQDYALPTRIVASGDAGNDIIIVDANVTVPVELNGEGGNDYLEAGSGTVTLRGGAGNDELIYTGKGTALLEGDGDNDRLDASGGNVTLRGGTGDDHLTGGVGTNSLDGGDNNDTLVGRNGLNTLIGGNGNDVLSAGSRGDRLIGGTGNDTLRAGAGADSIDGGLDENLIVWEVGDGNITLGDNGRNTFQAEGSTSADVFTVNRSGSGAQIVVTSASRPGITNTLTLQVVSMLNLDGGAGADTFTVNDLTGSRIEQASLNIGQMLNPDSATDRITINGTAGMDNLTVSQERVWVTEAQRQAAGAEGQPPIPTAGGIMRVTGLPNYTVRFANAKDDAIINTGASNDTVTIVSTTGPTTIITEAGRDILNVRSTRDEDLWGMLTLDGGAEANTLSVQVSAGMDSVDATLTDTQLTGFRPHYRTLANGTRVLDGKREFGITYRATGGFGDGLTFTTGAGNDTFRIRSTRAGHTTTIDTGTGTDTLEGADIVNTWQITGINVGTINGTAVRFSGAENLNGGLLNDTFGFGAGGSITGTINGRTGSDTLNYSLLATPVTVNLVTGTASQVGRIIGIENVIGGSGNDLLVGNADANLLVGNGGRDVLIGGTGKDRLEGGADDDLLVAGTTAYDSNPTLLNAIRNEWTMPSTYAIRVDRITRGTGVAPRLDTTTFTSNPEASTALGGEGVDLFYGTRSRVTHDLTTKLGEVFVGLL